ncbi:Replication factor C [Spironucleus salmonicida]|uniref:Replication factor C n=1 Tax=Spironucleus salmonicida TaxID=348837 RepID=V6LIQ3_9EUKA|nr:Replication factor C [Spironucleus salmonicida]|eukprot:EST43601.1 Replication factor C [Spironucleus salmonicida]
MLPFIEKHRPQTLEDVVGNEPIVDRLKYFSVNGGLPNILMASPPGQGKTTIAHCLGRAMLKNQFKEAFLELNASDQRNVSDVRDRVRGFAERQVTLPAAFQKLVFLDECDAMTAQAQLALRRIIEDFSHTTRFILACNDISKISESLQSRTCVLMLSPVTPLEIKLRILRISEIENIKIETAAAEEIAKLADGDVRNAVNQLQSAAVLMDNDIKFVDLAQVLDVLTEDQGVEIINLCQSDVNTAIKQCKEMSIDGFTGDEICQMLTRGVLSPKLSVSDLLRSRIMKLVAQAVARVSAGINGFVQIARCCAEISMVK